VQKSTPGARVRPSDSKKEIPLSAALAQGPNLPLRNCGLVLLFPETAIVICFAFDSSRFAISCVQEFVAILQYPARTQSVLLRLHVRCERKVKTAWRRRTELFVRLESERNPQSLGRLLFSPQFQFLSERQPQFVRDLRPELPEDVETPVLDHVIAHLLWRWAEATQCDYAHRHQPLRNGGAISP